MKPAEEQQELVKAIEIEKPPTYYASDNLNIKLDDEDDEELFGGAGTKAKA